jgi:short-chain 2-methylacyl-CoA dehydrogenase
MFQLGPDHEEFRSLVRDFATGEVEPHVHEWDRAHHFPTDLVPRMGELGLFGLVVPERYGGSLEDADGGAFTSLCIAIEELGRVDQSIGITLSAGVGLGINPILTYGTDEQKRDLPARPRRGPRPRGVRPHRAGRGLRRRRHPHQGPARRRRVGGERGQGLHHQLRHRHHHGRHRHGAHRHPRRRQGRDLGHHGPERAPGFEVEPPRTTSSAGTSPTPTACRSATAGCRPPTCSGSAGQGFKQFLKTLDDGRIAISALALGLITRMREEVTAYSQSRLAFGRPIAVNQGVSFQIADLAVMEETARLLTYKAAWLKDEQEAGRKSVAEVKQAASIAKLYTSEAAVSATRIATQIFGGNGFMEEYPVARFYRDAKILEIGEGTSEVQRMVIARGLGLPA